MSAIIVVIFMTIVFRINMGTTAALKELEAETLFSEEKVDGPLVKGIVASERTFLAQSSERLVLRKLVESFSNDDDAKKLGILNTTEKSLGQAPITANLENDYRCKNIKLESRLMLKTS